MVITRNTVSEILPESILDKVFIAGSSATRLAQISFDLSVVEGENIARMAGKRVIPASDIDLYLYNKDDYDKVKEAFIEKFNIEEPNKEIYATILADTFRHKDTGIRIQLVKPREDTYLKTYGDPEEVISYFDFTIIRVAYKPSNGKFIYVNKQETIEDLENNRLKIKSIVCPISIIYRIIKYQKKGYKLPVIETLKIFQEWDNRPISYKNQLIDLILRTENQELTEEEFNELEMLLRVD